MQKFKWDNQCGETYFRLLYRHREKNFPKRIKVATWKSLRALSICQNWPAGSLPDQSVWQRNRLFTGGLDEKPSSTCIKFRIWLILLENEVKLLLRRERPDRSVLTNGKRPKLSYLPCTNKCFPDFYILYSSSIWEYFCDLKTRKGLTLSK